MSTLNDPVGYERGDADDNDWSPRRGRRRGLAAAALATLVLSVLVLPIAWYLPHLLIIGATRTGIVFAATWLVLRVVTHSAGMVGGWCVGVTLVCVTFFMLIHHVVFALHGVPGVAGAIESWWLFPANLVATLDPRQGPMMRGLIWFHPYALLALNAVPLLLGAAGCIWMYGRE